MSEVMASPSVAIDSLFAGSGSASGGEGEGGQAKAPSASDTPKSAPEAAGKGESTTGKAPESTTAKVEGAATPPAKESADLPDEFKPFDRTLKAKKWDPKSKDFAPTVLKSFEDLEKSFTQSNQDKSLLATRQSELQKRLMGDPKAINEWRKANRLPEIPVAKSYADQAKEKAALFTRFQELFNPETQKAAIEALNAHFADMDDLRIKAAIEAERKQGPNPENPLQELRAAGDSNFRQFSAQVKDADELFGQYVMPLFQPNGLLGSLGLDIAHAAISQAHLQGFDKLARALKLAENYDAALKEGIDKGVDAAMEAKRKAGNAGSVGEQGKQSGGDGDRDSAIREFWAGRHG